MKQLLCCCILFFSPLSATIVQINTLDLFEKELAQIDQKSLVVVDVDDTLIFPRDAILHSSHKPLLAKISKEMAQQLLPTHPLEHLESKVMSKMRHAVIDERSVHILRDAQQRGI